MGKVVIGKPGNFGGWKIRNAGDSALLLFVVNYVNKLLYNVTDRWAAMKKKIYMYVMTSGLKDWK